MLKICLVFCKSEPQYAYKRYAYKKKHVCQIRLYEGMINCKIRREKFGVPKSHLQSVLYICSI